ncbi:hypothetical protein G6011_01048 [Alternaria panax]|uniref:CorA-like transporter domain-containing protein n=1 Tax=Alternaria panax TaxID=48097 RepID=A0AAD4IJA4_9PLEO|nr:hypothetical protein G6011_01048 [Alternaria panax]
MCRIPLELQDSYLSSGNYPENLIPSDTATYTSKLASYKRRLDYAQNDLCLISGQDEIDKVFDIPVIDLNTADGKERDSRHIHTPAKVTRWLAVEVQQQDRTNPNVQEVVARTRDPRCRFICFYGKNSRAKLKTTRDSLCQIMSYHQVMPVYLDFMLVFGAQSDAKDLRFSGFREQIRLKTPASGHSASELGRSGKHFQLCYNLKGVQFKQKSDVDITLDEWSIRDAAIYHKFDVEYGTTLWIVTKGGRDLRDRYAELTRSTGRSDTLMYNDATSCFRSSLATHLLYCQWSAEDWRWYIIWLEKVVDQESRMAVDGLRDSGRAQRQYEARDIQDLQYWQEKTNEAVMVLEANAKILRTLHRFYSNLIVRSDFPDTLKKSCEDHLYAFFSQLNEISGDFDMQLARAKLLVNIISDRKQLVLQHLQSQVSDRTEKLNQNLEKEAVVMRIITILTLIYLPATFVSTLFSTDIVKYQDQNQSSVAYEKGSFSTLALQRWLQVTIPLTALTLFGAWSTYRFYDVSARHLAFIPRLKRAVLHLAPSEASSHVQAQPEDLSGNQNVTSEGSVKRLGASISRLTSRLQRSGKRPSALPRYQGDLAKSG